MRLLNEQRVPRFHSGLFTTDPRTAPGFYRGAGFVFRSEKANIPEAARQASNGFYTNHGLSRWRSTTTQK